VDTRDGQRGGFPLFSASILMFPSYKSSRGENYKKKQIRVVMLAYGKGRHLQFHGGEEVLSASLTSVVARLETPSWKFPMGSDSSDDSDVESKASASTESREDPRSAAPLLTPPELMPYSYEHGKTVTPFAPPRSAGPAGVPPLSIYPAEHNSIAEPSKLISQPWSSLFSFEAFNAVQSLCFNVAACTDKNLVVSGKNAELG